VTALRAEIAQASQQVIEAKFPEAFKELFEPARYKVYYGGRGSAKSWSFARALLLMGMQRPLRILCARELQKSIADSVHQLLWDQIRAMGLEWFYYVEKAKIYGANGTTFGFAGIRHNITEIKSYEGADVVWVEEANKVSNTSWNILIPTIRKEGSEIWLSFNPELESDATYQRFVKFKPANSIVKKVSWRDNPYFNDTMRQEMEDLKSRNYDEYLHVWEGHCTQTLEGAIYAEEIRLMTLEKRITKVPYDRIRPVDVIFDLGRSDMTAMWYIQQVGFEHRAVEYHEDNGHDWAHYMKLVQRSDYTIGTIYLPHDAKAKTIGTQKSVEEQTRAVFGAAHTRLVPKLSVHEGILAVRSLFPNLYIDEDKCDEGLHALRHYQYDVENGQRSKNPMHNWASHGADALRYYAVGKRDPKPRGTLALKVKSALRLPGTYSQGWMQ
jgi:phage terminase large subunit